MEQGQPNRRRRGRKRRKKKAPCGIILVLFVLLIVIGTVSIFLFKRYTPNKEQADLDNYFGITSSSQMAITVKNQVIEQKGILAEGKVYLPLDAVHAYINERFYWDGNESVLLFTLPEDQIKVSANSKDYMISNVHETKEYVIVKVENDTVYIALDFIKQYSNIVYEVFDSPNRVVITSANKEENVATVKSSTQVRYQGGIKSSILTKVKKGDKVAIIENEENWSKVCTKTGFVGYIKKEALSDVNKEVLAAREDYAEPQFTHLLLDKKINMAWHNVTNNTANAGITEKLSDTEGINVLAPTWFHVADTSGNISSIASSDYVNTAHQKGIEVWATLRDFDGGISTREENLAVLSSTNARANIINSIIGESLKVGIDGINIDFEMVSEEASVHFIQFIRELSVECRRNRIVLSVDNYVPRGYNAHYNRKEQGYYADYVVIMGYDEYYAGSEEAGPVSSYEYVKSGIEETIKDVPKEQVISGVAFFSRLWKEEGAGVSSEAYGMSMAQSKITEAGATATWDDKTKLTYATWSTGGVTYKIWLEDAKSLEEKLKLVPEYDIAGSAEWSLGQEDASVWPVIAKYSN
jgi:spore germination protein YaaH